MLQLRTILYTKVNKKGFTLAELLVVVAIIAILVAVSIPIFSG
ncbi:MAG: prepilin-type N-terminal cleavage/methylation domain-containing protein, partial [Anaerovoracaceae bacterium]